MKIYNWIKIRIKHKLSHLKLSYFKSLIKEHGIALFVIVVLWEIIEDIFFPLVFVWLGNNIHPIFLVGAPASWLLCLHWLAVPMIWSVWIKIKNKNNSNYKHGCDHEH